MPGKPVLSLAAPHKFGRNITRVAIAARMLGPVFLPEQPTGHPGAAQFLIDVGPVRFGTADRRDVGRRRKQPPLQRRVGHLLGQRPGEPCGTSPSQVLADGALADPQRSGDHAARL